MSFDPGMDIPPERWTSPEIDPTFPAVQQPAPDAENVENPTGEVTHFAGAGDMHAETIEAIAKGNAAIARLILQQMMAGWQIIRLDAGANPIPQSQHVRFRVQRVIVNPITAGTLTLTLGTVTYPFEGAARLGYDVPFPLVIERATDMSCVGVDGRLWLLGIPE